MNRISKVLITNKKQELFGFIIYWQNYRIYYDFFGIEYIPQEVINKIKDKSTTENTIIIQSDDSVRCEFIIFILLIL